MTSKINIIHYLNTHFVGLGGEEKASLKPILFDLPTGQNERLQSFAEGKINTLCVIAGGDNYAAENEAAAIEEILRIVQDFLAHPYLETPDIFFAGPCYKAGRYGNFAQALCKAVSKNFGIPAVIGMAGENPGIETYKDDSFSNKKNVYVVETSNNVTGTKKAWEKMISLAMKLVNNETVGPKSDGYIPRGRRVNVFTEKPGAERALDMLMKKVRGEPFETEMPLIEIKSVVPAPALIDFSKAKIALGTSGGIVPARPILNPDKIASSDAKNWGMYSLEGIDALAAETHQSVHGGYDQSWANANPNLVLPVDLMRQLEKEGVIGSLHNEYFVTVGNGTEVASAERMAREVVPRLKSAGVEAVILTST
ncbi:glycine/betaine/sarcosine/D-proline family reductase selenoprotein B [Patescibacteria group bacterium]|nr:glycine/betaine/sarcosine/D-proline family reductase selenoprotein B [Patescibacteria group bacterium]